MKKVDIFIFNGIDVVATCSTADCSLSVRVLKEFLDAMRYDLDADSICVKENNLSVITISFLSHCEIVVNGTACSYVDGVDFAANMLTELWG